MLLFWFSMMPLCGILNLSSSSSRSSISHCVGAFVQPPSYSLRVYTAPSYSLEFQVGICNELLEFWLPATRNCLLHEFSSRPFHSDTFTTHSFSKDWYIMMAWTLSAKIRSCVEDEWIQYSAFCSYLQWIWYFTFLGFLRSVNYSASSASLLVKKIVWFSSLRSFPSVTNSAFAVEYWSRAWSTYASRVCVPSFYI